MIREEATPIVVDIAKRFISLIRKIDPTWSKAYLRFRYQDFVAETKASYVHQRGTDIIDALAHKDFFREMNVRGQELLSALDKSEGLFLVIVDSNFDYEIKFEYKDMEKWRITKMRDGTGIPTDVD